MCMAHICYTHVVLDSTDQQQTSLHFLPSFLDNLATSVGAQIQAQALSWESSVDCLQNYLYPQISRFPPSQKLQVRYLKKSIS